MRVLPAPGAADSLPGHGAGEVGGVVGVLVELTAAQAASGLPRDGEVQVPLCGQVAEQEG